LHSSDTVTELEIGEIPENVLLLGSGLPTAAVDVDHGGPGFVVVGDVEVELEFGAAGSGTVDNVALGTEALANERGPFARQFLRPEHGGGKQKNCRQAPYVHIMNKPVHFRAHVIWQSDEKVKGHSTEIDQPCGSGHPG
jgi:hypothetical protein